MDISLLSRLGASRGVGMVGREPVEPKAASCKSEGLTSERSMRLKWILTSLVLACFGVPEQGFARPEPCLLPQKIAPAPERPAPANEVSRTSYDYYLLAMTWSPEWCRERANLPSERLQCRDNSFGFVLHGLWPSASKGPHPRYCRAAPQLSEETVGNSLCMTPSTLPSACAPSSPTHQKGAGETEAAVIAGWALTVLGRRTIL